MPTTRVERTERIRVSNDSQSENGGVVSSTDWLAAVARLEESNRRMAEPCPNCDEGDETRTCYCCEILREANAAEENLRTMKTANHDYIK